MKSEVKEPTFAARMAALTGNPVVEVDTDGLRLTFINCNGKKQRPAGERSPYAFNAPPVLGVDPTIDTIQ
jgi:hypothetical protein